MLEQDTWKLNLKEGKIYLAHGEGWQPIVVANSLWQMLAATSLILSEIR